VPIIRQEKRHIRQHITDTDRLDEKPPHTAGFIRGQNTIFAGAQREFSFINLVPDDLVYSKWIARRWWKQIDDEDMNPCAQTVDDFFKEVAQGGAAVLVPRGDNLNYGNGAAQAMLDHDAVCACGIKLLGCAAREPSN